MSLFLISIYLVGVSSCTLEKQYHSWGWKINSKYQGAGKTTKTGFTATHSDKQWEKVTYTNPAITANRNTGLSAKQPMPNEPKLLVQKSSNTWLTTTINQPTISNSRLYTAIDNDVCKNASLSSSFFLATRPLDTVFFPEKYQHRRHGTLYLPQIKNEDEFNTATAYANAKDVTAWNWFDRGHISSKIALYWLFGLMTIIIIIGLGNISLAGIASKTRKTITTALILIPAILFAVGYICYLLGTFSIWSANKLYKKALFKLPYDLKLRGDAVIMHARIPYVSKGATLRTAKRILSTYPNDRNGEWLEDVSKTKREIETGRTSLTINNWSRMRSVGFIVTLLLLGILAIKFI